MLIACCQNTPAKGARYCEIHKDVTKEYVNDEIGVGNIASKSDESTGLLIVKVLNEKCTRSCGVFIYGKNDCSAYPEKVFSVPGLIMVTTAAPSMIVASIALGTSVRRVVLASRRSVSSYFFLGRRSFPRYDKDGGHPWFSCLKNSSKSPSLV